jgi:hypothetical protein
MLNTFKQVIQYESSKLCNYEFLKIKLVDEKHIKKAKRLMLSKFSNISNNLEIRYKYTHACGNLSFIEISVFSSLKKIFGITTRKKRS